MFHRKRRRLFRQFVAWRISPRIRRVWHLYAAGKQYILRRKRHLRQRPPRRRDDCGSMPPCCCRRHRFEQIRPRFRRHDRLCARDLCRRRRIRRRFARRCPPCTCDNKRRNCQRHIHWGIHLLQCFLRSVQKGKSEAALPESDSSCKTSPTPSGFPTFTAQAATTRATRPASTT